MIFRKGFQTKILCKRNLSVNISVFKESSNFCKCFCERFNDNGTILKSEESYWKTNVSCSSIARLEGGVDDK